MSNFRKRKESEPEPEEPEVGTIEWALSFNPVPHKAYSIQMKLDCVQRLDGEFDGNVVTAAKAMKVPEKRLSDWKDERHLYEQVKDKSKKRLRGEEKTKIDKALWAKAQDEIQLKRLVYEQEQIDKKNEQTQNDEQQKAMRLIMGEDEDIDAEIDAYSDTSPVLVSPKSAGKRRQSRESTCTSRSSDESETELRIPVSNKCDSIDSTRQRRSYSLRDKLDFVKLLQCRYEGNASLASRELGVDRKRLREWQKYEAEIRETIVSERRHSEVTAAITAARQSQADEAGAQQSMVQEDEPPTQQSKVRCTKPAAPQSQTHVDKGTASTPRQSQVDKDLQSLYEQVEAKKQMETTKSAIKTSPAPSHSSSTVQYTKTMESESGIPSLYNEKLGPASMGGTYQKPSQTFTQPALTDQYDMSTEGSSAGQGRQEGQAASIKEDVKPAYPTQSSQPYMFQNLQKQKGYVMDNTQIPQVADTEQYISRKVDEIKKRYQSTPTNPSYPAQIAPSVSTNSTFTRTYGDLPQSDQSSAPNIIQLNKNSDDTNNNPNKYSIEFKLNALHRLRREFFYDLDRTAETLNISKTSLQTWFDNEEQFIIEAHKFRRGESEHTKHTLNDILGM